MSHASRPAWTMSALLIGLLLGCNPRTSRPPFSPLPAAVEAELELPVGVAVGVIADALRADSIPVALVQERDGYLETPWFLARDGTPTTDRPIGVEVVRVRAWASPGRVGHSDIQVEAVYRPMADPSRPARELEQLVPAEHPVAKRIEAVVARLVTEFGHPEQLPPKPVPATKPDTTSPAAPKARPDSTAKPDTMPRPPTLPRSGVRPPAP